MWKKSVTAGQVVGVRGDLTSIAKCGYAVAMKVTAEKAALRRAAEILGGQASLARALGYKDRRNVWEWVSTDRPLRVQLCPLIERATGGKVRCEELRPDVAWDVIRRQDAV